MGTVTHTDPDTGLRYLDEVVYEPVFLDSGVRVGWKVPDGAERDRWDNPPKIANPAPVLKLVEARPLAHLIAELEPWVDFNSQLEQMLRSSYDDQPRRTNRVVDSVVRGAEAKRLSNPAGLLVSRLREIQKGNDDERF